MEFNNKKPIYIQICDYIKYAIIRGELKPNEQLESVREMALKYEVNPNTAQRALSELRAEGVIYSVRGSGNFVTEDKNTINKLREAIAKDIFNDFTEKVTKIGLEKTDVLKLLEDNWRD